MIYNIISQQRLSLLLNTQSNQYILNISNIKSHQNQNQKYLSKQQTTQQTTRQQQNINPPDDKKYPSSKLNTKTNSKMVRQNLQSSTNIEGRDKFCKMIQYACRYLKFRYNKIGNKQMEKKVDALFCAMRDARKLFRLFKSIKQYGKLVEIIAKRKTTPFINFIFSALARIFFLLYWIYDNLNILAKLGLLQKDAKSLAKKGATCWFIALIADLIPCLKNIVVNIYPIIISSKNTKTQIEMKQDIFNSQQSAINTQKIKQIKKVINSQLLTLMKIVGDMLPAGQGCEFYSKTFNFNVNQGWCGIGGFVSAFLTSYNLYYG